MSGPVAGPRQVRSIVTINGAACSGMISWSAENNEFTTPDTFDVTFALNGLPSDKGASWWASTPEADVEIFVGRPTDPSAFTAGDLTSIFVGKVDDVAIDWAAATLHINGRDLSAPLVDTKASEKYTNKTPSQIAQALAAKYGLTPVVTASAPTDYAGKLYAGAHVDLKEERTEWELLTWLGRQQGFVLYMKGRELHFEPRGAASDAKPFVLKREAATQARTEAGNYVTFSTSHSLTLAGDIRVTVKSWVVKSKKAYFRFAVKHGKGKRKQEYNYIIPGLTPDGAQQRAQKILAEISKHETRLSFSGPADESLHITTSISLEGTGTAFDQPYFPESIHREFDPEDGYSWTVAAKNHPTETEASV